MTWRKLGRRAARSSSSSRNASCAGAISVSHACALISCSSTSSSKGWCSTRVPPDSSQTTSEEARPANDIGENADSMVAPCGTSLSSETARPPAIRPRWARGTGRKPSEVRSNEISAALRPSWITARVVVDSLQDRIVERGHAFRQIRAEAADMADRKRFGRGVHGQIGIDDAVDLARGHDRPRRGAVERHGQFRLPPQ